jgi:hypothetical protein
MTKTGPRVLTGRNPHHYSIPDDHTWSEIAGRLKLSSDMPEPLKTQLIGWTMMYSMVGPGLGPSKSLPTVLKHLRVWRTRTQSLRRSLWVTETEVTLPIRNQRESSRADLRNTHLTFRKRSFRRINAAIYDPLAKLALTLDAALAVCDHVIAEIATDKPSNLTATDMWPVWVGLLIKSLDQFGINVTSKATRGEARRLKAGFASFVAALQETVPQELRIRIAHNSLRKGIGQASKLTRERSIDELMLLMSIPVIFPNIPKQVRSHRFVRSFERSLVKYKDRGRSGKRP